MRIDDRAEEFAPDVFCGSPFTKCWVHANAAVIIECACFTAEVCTVTRAPLTVVLPGVLSQVAITAHVFRLALTVWIASLKRVVNISYVKIWSLCACQAAEVSGIARAVFNVVFVTIVITAAEL